MPPARLGEFFQLFRHRRSVSTGRSDQHGKWIDPERYLQIVLEQSQPSGLSFIGLFLARFRALEGHTCDFLQMVHQFMHQHRKLWTGRSRPTIRQMDDPEAGVIERDNGERIVRPTKPTFRMLVKDRELERPSSGAQSREAVACRTAFCSMPTPSSSRRPTPR
jgi:hypothetical protein